jgi:oligoendopeptidase F
VPPLRRSPPRHSAVDLPGPVANVAERSAIPERYRWDLTPLYPSVEAWKGTYESLARDIPAFDGFRGTLGASGAALYTALSRLMDLDGSLSRLAVYASMLSDEDVRVAAHLAMRQDAEQLGVALSTSAAFVRPELLALGSRRVLELVAEEPRLAPYRPWLDDILRYESHTLSVEQERIAAQAGRFAGASETVRSVFTKAEMPYPVVTLSSGERVRLDAAGYSRYRALPERADREVVFHAFWSKHAEFSGTLGAALNGRLQTHVFHRDVHRFGSCLEASLFRSNIPTAVYHRLIENVRANLGTLHRYFGLRRRLMGIDTLRYSDLYAPIIPKVELKFTPEEARDRVLAALAPLGAAYGDALGRAFEERWVDWLPSTGKSNGAYSTGAYGVHPYQMQNFTGLYEEVGTLAHECGHSLHTFLSDQAQPYVTHDYALFVAEVASTLNENLLFHHMLEHTKDPATRLFLLGSHLDHLRGTLFRQTMFAEFELVIHEKAEAGETLTGDELARLYLDLVRRYHGHDQGVCEVDALYGGEWAYVDHFFYNFYVYQYATSVVAAEALAQGIREEAARGGGATGRRDTYLKMLASGSSRYPIDLLRDAGVDMTTDAPFRSAIDGMNAVMDEIDRLSNGN